MLSNTDSPRQIRSFDFCSFSLLSYSTFERFYIQYICGYCLSTQNAKKRKWTKVGIRECQVSSEKPVEVSCKTFICSLCSATLPCRAGTGSSRLGSPTLTFEAAPFFVLVKNKHTLRQVETGHRFLAADASRPPSWKAVRGIHFAGKEGRKEQGSWVDTLSVTGQSDFFTWRGAGW